jgi:hypothetical protein
MDAQDAAAKKASLELASRQYLEAEQRRFREHAEAARKAAAAEIVATKSLVDEKLRIGEAAARLASRLDGETAAEARRIFDERAGALREFAAAQLAAMAKKDLAVHQSWKDLALAGGAVGEAAELSRLVATRAITLARSALSTGESSPVGVIPAEASDALRRLCEEDRRRAVALRADHREAALSAFASLKNGLRQLGTVEPGAEAWQALAASVLPRGVEGVGGQVRLDVARGVNPPSLERDGAAGETVRQNWPGASVVGPGVVPELAATLERFAKVPDVGSLIGPSVEAALASAVAVAGKAVESDVRECNKEAHSTALAAFDSPRRDGSTERSAEAWRALAMSVFARGVGGARGRADLEAAGTVGLSPLERRGTAGEATGENRPGAGAVGRGVLPAEMAAELQRLMKAPDFGSLVERFVAAGRASVKAAAQQSVDELAKTYSSSAGVGPNGSPIASNGALQTALRPAVAKLLERDAPLTAHLGAASYANGLPPSVAQRVVKQERAGEAVGELAARERAPDAVRSLMDVGRWPGPGVFRSGAALADGNGAGSSVQVERILERIERLVERAVETGERACGSSVARRASAASRYDVPPPPLSAHGPGPGRL